MIIHGDSLEVLKRYPDKHFDWVITDPPYGLNIAKNGKVGGAGKNFIGKLVDSRTYTASQWDKHPPTKELFDELFRVSKNQIIFGGNHFELPARKKWIVWDKKATGNFSKCELIWTSLTGAIDKFEWEWNGFIQGNGSGGRQRVKRVHPSQKPVELMEYLIKNYTKETDTICDPFMGSGTTLVAARNLGRDATGIEISDEYCEVAAGRLTSQEKKI